MVNLNYIAENNILNEPSQNLFSNFMMFNDAFTWNVASGTATALNIDGEQLEGARCLRITPSIGTGATVNSGGSQTAITIPNDGSYILSIKHKSEFSNSGANQNININVYVNEVLTQYRFSAIYANNGVYRTYYQVINDLTAGDIVEFEFNFSTGDIGGVYKNYFDCFKFERDSFGLGIPTVFSYPNQSEATQTIDIPNIASNDSYTVVATLNGALVGDYVKMTYPNELITLGLTVGYPIVTNVNEVSFIVHNHSGSSANPASGIFKFKIA